MYVLLSSFDFPPSYIQMACNMGDSLSDTTGDDDVVDNSESDIGAEIQTVPRIANVGQKRENTLEKKQRRQDQGVYSDSDNESDNKDNNYRPSSTLRPWRRRTEGVEGYDYDDDDCHRGYLSSATTVSPSAVVKDLVLPASPADSNTTAAAAAAAVDVNDSKSDYSSSNCSNSRIRSGQRRHDANRKTVAPENGHGQSSPLESSGGGDSAIASREETAFETKANRVSGGLETSPVSCASSEPRYHCLPGLGASSRSRSGSPGVISNNGRGWKGAIAAFDVPDGSDGESAEYGVFPLDIRRQQQQEKGGNGSSYSGAVCLGGESGTGVSRDNVHKIQQQHQQQEMESRCKGGLYVEGDAGMVIVDLKNPPISVEGDDSAWWAYSDDSGS